MTKVASFAAAPDSTFGRNSNGQSQQQDEPRRDSTPQAPDDLRLIIEEDQATGSIVYVTVNRRTGDVVQRYPREELLRMREDTAYVVGGVIRTKA